MWTKRAAAIVDARRSNRRHPLLPSRTRPQPPQIASTRDGVARVNRVRNRWASTATTAKRNKLMPRLTSSGSTSHDALVPNTSHSRLLASTIPTVRPIIQFQR